MPLYSRREAIRPWLICLSASLFFFYAFLQMNLLNAMSAELIAEFHITKLGLGNFSASYLYALAIFYIPTGLLLDRTSTRLLMLIGLSIEIIAIVLFATAPNLEIAVLGRILSGMVHAIAFLGCLRLVSRWLPSYMGLVMGLIVTVGMLGGLLAQAPMTELVDMIGWREATGLTAVLGIIIWIAVWGFVKDFPNEKLVPSKLPLVWKNIKESIVNVQNWLCAIYASLLNLPLILIGALWGNLFLIHEAELTKIQAAFVVSMIYVGTMLGSPIVGWLSDKLKRRKLPMIVGAMLSLLVILPITFIDTLSFYPLAILFFLLGLVTSTQTLSYPTITENNAPALTSTALGFANVIIMGSGGILQPIFGWLMEQNWQTLLPENLIDNYRFAFLLIPIGFAASLSLAFFIRETYCSYQE